jgi:hypothetical protein
VGLPGQLQERQLEVLLGVLLVLLGVLLLEVQQQINPVILATGGGSAGNGNLKTLDKKPEMRRIKD